jgi:hypothetical protein
MSEVPVTAPGEVIIARASRDYRWRRYLLAIVLFGYGLYSAYDGFDRYPRENNEDRGRGLEIVRHPGFDVQFNKAFGVGLPPLSLLFICWVIYSSRGKYEFDGVTVTTPANGAVPLKAIRRIDRTNWDRKGIAYLHYQVPGSSKLGVIKLDDFVYERRPTDEIFRQVAAVVESNKPAAVSTPQRMICSFCGVPNSPTNATCTNCGAPLTNPNAV